MKRFAGAMAFLVCCATFHLSEAVADDAAPSQAEAFAWIKRVDGEVTKPRYASLTIEQVPTLVELRIGGHRKSDKKHLFIKPEEFKHLTALPALKKLHLGENDGVTDEGLVYVGKLTGLQELVLWDAPMTDDGMKHLTKLSELTSLDLAFATKLTTASLEPISQLPKLEKLTLAGTKVDDVSVLSKATALRELHLGKLRPAGIEKLQAANPKLMIELK